MDAPGILVTVLGLLAGGGLAWGVVGWQRAGILARERAAERRRVEVLERTVEARRRSVVALADLAAGRWRGDAITVRGTMPVRRG